MSEDILNKFKQVQDEKKSAESDKVLKIGIIGTGWIAEPHVTAYLKCKDAKIVACADLVDGKAEAFCKKMGLEN
ncbi:MAG TPA: gfo/Idh/MocA family oxidoreductase, partial [Clostridia bacterium]|nr:gfo/Idh/MocA family oxidoreductase [Clostridia bacterium]